MLTWCSFNLINPTLKKITTPLYEDKLPSNEVIQSNKNQAIYPTKNNEFIQPGESDHQLNLNYDIAKNITNYDRVDVTNIEIETSSNNDAQRNEIIIDNSSDFLNITSTLKHKDNNSSKENQENNTFLGINRMQT